jgi:uncharacterized membrane protein SpoIIM required for sporulation
MKTVVGVILLAAVMLAGAFGVHNIWEWLSLVSEGNAHRADLQPFLLSLLLLAIVIAVAIRTIDWLTDPPAHGR